MLIVVLIGCRSSCPEKEQDFGGCRCQAFALTGDASQPDPVCTKSDQRGQIDAALTAANCHNASSSALQYRTWSASQNIITSTR